MSLRSAKEHGPCGLTTVKQIMIQEMVDNQPMEFIHLLSFKPENLTYSLECSSEILMLNLQLFNTTIMVQVSSVMLPLVETLKFISSGKELLSKSFLNTKISLVSQTSHHSGLSDGTLDPRVTRLLMISRPMLRDTVMLVSHLRESGLTLVLPKEEPISRLTTQITMMSLDTKQLLLLLIKS